MGRWQVVHKNPQIILDTGHNEAGIKYISDQLSNCTYKSLRIVHRYGE